MIRAIFDLFRHGRAEGDVSRRDPFILVKTFGPGLIEDDSSVRQPAVEFRWASSGDGRLSMSWTLGSSVEHANGVRANVETAA